MKRLSRWAAAAGIVFYINAPGIIAQDKAPTDLSGLLKQMAVDGQAQQHARDAQQLNLCVYFAGMAGNTALQQELSDKLKTSVMLAGMSEEDAESQAWLSMQMAIVLVEGYRQGYEDRLLESGGDLSKSKTLEEFAVSASRSMYKNQSCEQWGSL